MPPPVPTHSSPKQQDWPERMPEPCASVSLPGFTSKLNNIHVLAHRRAGGSGDSPRALASTAGAPAMGAHRPELFPWKGQGDTSHRGAHGTMA